MPRWVNQPDRFRFILSETFESATYGAISEATSNRREAIMPFWLGNPTAIFVFALVSGIVALGIGSLHRGDVQFWRVTETVATVIGGLSIVLLSFNIQHTFAARYFDGFRQAYGGASAVLTSQVNFIPRYMCETKFMKASTSPENFDDIVADQAKLCDWSKNIQAVLNKIHFDNLDPIDPSLFKPPVQKTDAWKSQIDEYAIGAKDYIDFRNEALDLKSKSEISDWQLAILAFAPFFLCLALAMQLAKVQFK